MKDLFSGIDVSKWQGSINWKKVASDGVDFAMIRSSYGSEHTDEYLKKNVAGCEKYGIELLTFTAAELGDTKGSFTASDFVKKTVGVDNVCERAVCAAGAELTHKKTAADGVTFALGTLKSTVDFGRGH